MHACSVLKAGVLSLALMVLESGAALAASDVSRPATITVQTGRPACRVEIDRTPAGVTDSQGSLAIQNVEPIEHYLHVRCPGEEEETYRVSLRPGAGVVVRADRAVDAPALSALEAAQLRIELRRLVRHAVQERSEGQFDAAVRDLHQAAAWDPKNSDLHRELGITFLLQKDWKRAQVEMLEAIRRDPTDADAHNGLGYALEKMGDSNAALGEFRAATRLDPDDPSYRRHYLEALAKVEAGPSRKK